MLYHTATETVRSGEVSITILSILIALLETYTLLIVCNFKMIYLDHISHVVHVEVFLACINYSL